MVLPRRAVLGAWALVVHLLTVSVSCDLEGSLAYISSRHGNYVEELKEIVSIPSVSAQAAHLPDILKAADWVKGRLVKAGLQVRRHAYVGIS